MEKGADVREGWDEAFRRMHKNGDDVLLDPDQRTSFGDEEWEWEDDERPDSHGVNGVNGVNGEKS